MWGLPLLWYANDKGEMRVLPNSSLGVVGGGVGASMGEWGSFIICVILAPRTYFILTLLHIIDRRFSRLEFEAKIKTNPSKQNVGRRFPKSLETERLLINVN